MTKKVKVEYVCRLCGIITEEYNIVRPYNRDSNIVRNDVCSDCLNSEIEKIRKIESLGLQGRKKEKYKRRIEKRDKILFDLYSLKKQATVRFLEPYGISKSKVGRALKRFQVINL